MRLSDAIMLGRVTVDSPKSGDINNCALGMAANACGIKRQYCNIKKLWPWLKTDMDFPCNCFPNSYINIDSQAAWTKVAHIFDHHVMCLEDWTLEQLVDWVRSVEPGEREEGAKDEPSECREFTEQPRVAVSY
jgi:hypothetical protein